MCVYRLEPDPDMTDNTHRQWYIFITQYRTVTLANKVMKRKFKVRNLLGRWNNVPPAQITRESICNALYFMHWFSSKHVASIGGSNNVCSMYKVTDITDIYIMKVIKTVLIKLWKG